MQAIVYVFVEPFILNTHCGFEKQANKLIIKHYCMYALGCAVPRNRKKSTFFRTRKMVVFLKNQYTLIAQCTHNAVCKAYVCCTAHTTFYQCCDFLLHLMSFFLLFTLSNVKFTCNKVENSLLLISI